MIGVVPRFMKAEARSAYCRLAINASLIDPA
jgi:hypothetical protein